MLPKYLVITFLVRDYKIGIFRLFTKAYLGIMQLYLPAKPGKI